MEMEGKEHIKEVESVGLCDEFMRGESKRVAKNDFQVSGWSNCVVGALHWHGEYKRKSTLGKGAR